MRKAYNPANIRISQLSKTYNMEKINVDALDRIDLEIRQGEFLAIEGPSGSGKSTLLGLLGGLDTPSNGSIHIGNQKISHLPEKDLAEIRNQKVGFVFQFFNLIPTLTAEENIALPALFAPGKSEYPKTRMNEILDFLQLGDRCNHYPRQLSGGEKQRVAIGRALINNPDILLCDEPTGNLDTATGQQILDYFSKIRKTYGTTVILITHNPEVAILTDRRILLVDGRIVQDEKKKERQSS